MKIAKRMGAAFLIGTLVLGAMALPAEAGGRRFRGGGHHRVYRGGHGHFIGGFLPGIAAGVILGTIFAPRVYYEAPRPVYQPPAPVCRDIWVNGHWVERRYADSPGYERFWVEGYWEQRCY